MARGKNQDARYVGIAAQIPKDLRRQFRVKLAMLELDANTTLEILVRRFVSGETVITSKDLETVGLQDIPEAIPQDIPKASPVPSPKPKTPKPSTSPDEGALELANIRDKLGMTRQQLADALGNVPNTSKSAIGRYERGVRDVPPEVLEAARALITGEG